MRLRVYSLDSWLNVINAGWTLEIIGKIRKVLHGTWSSANVPNIKARTWWVIPE